MTDAISIMYSIVFVLISLISLKSLDRNVSLSIAVISIFQIIVAIAVGRYSNAISKLSVIVLVLVFSLVLLISSVVYYAWSYAK